jgi:ATP-dependent DNA helicase DinG
VKSHNTDTILGEDGALSQRIQGFSARQTQLEMAQAIEQTIESDGTLLVEAGTGTGKTFAYLVPSLLSGKKTIIATGTKNLQDQLFEKDLPVLKQCLPNTSALLKGRSNYLCLYRLELTENEGLLYDKQAVSDLAAIHTWKSSTRSGDISDCVEVSENASIWPMVTSTQHNCLGQECPLIDECYLMKARKKALTADTVVVNHHLFFADLAIKEEGFGDLLPHADILIFDEAHQLPDIASRFFSTTFSSRQVMDLCQDLALTRIQEASDFSQLTHATARLEKVLMDMRLQFGVNPQRSAWVTPSAALNKSSCA